MVPRRATVAEALGFARSRADWIVRRVDEVETRHAQAAERMARIAGADRGLILHDQPLSLQRLNGSGPPPPVDADAAAIDRWYRNYARTWLGGILDEEARRLGFTPARLAIRDQKTRWGSCSARGTISLNWRLVLAPPEVARYVVIHELVHLRIANHSTAFWHAMTEAMPGWREHRTWLRAHGAGLHVYKPAPA